MSIVDEINWHQVARELESEVKDNGKPLFYMREVQNKARTIAEGRVCFDLVPYVEIRTPGTKSNIPNERVTEEHKARWPMHWLQFQNKEKVIESGTPVSQWPFLNRAQVAELQALNIFTVEQVRDLSDAALQKIGPGGRDMKKRAGEFLKPAGEVEVGLRSELAALEQKFENMKAENAQLWEQLQARDEPKPKKGAA